MLRAHFAQQLWHLICALKKVGKCDLQTQFKENGKSLRHLITLGPKMPKYELHDEKSCLKIHC